MRWALLLFAGCAFHVRATPSDGASDIAFIDGVPPHGDAFVQVDASPDGPVDARPDAMPDAPADAATVPVTFVTDTTAQASATNRLSVQLPPAIAGDLNIVAASWPGVTASLVSVTDSDGNTYTEVGSALTIGTAGTMAVFIAPNVVQGAAANTLTLQFSGSVNVVVVAGVYRGLSATPLDVETGQSAFTGTTLDSGAATTTSGHELLVGIGAAQHGLSAGTGYTARTSGSIDILEDREVTLTGTYHATATSSSNTLWLMRLVALRALQ